MWIVPVVASNCSSLPEQIIHEKGGYLCSTGDVNSYAEALIQLNYNHQLRKKMGLYNRQKIEENFTFIKMVDSYQDLFKELDRLNKYNY